jgi:glycosyltransferase involved in cell wall biosynthesis
MNRRARPGKRTVLLVTYHFAPSAASGSHRLLGFARHLPKFGWHPVVVAPPRMPLEPLDPELLKLVPPEAVVRHVPFPQGQLVRLLRRFTPKAVWLPRAWLACARAIQEQRPDVLLTSGPPHSVHALGLFLTRRYGLPWLADFRDPWVANDSGGQSLPRARRWEAAWERAVMRAADSIIANAPRALATLQAAFPQWRGKMTTITNGYDPERFGVPVSGRRPEQCLRIVHAGELYYGRDPRPFFDALQAFARDHPGASQPALVGFLGKDADAGFSLSEEVDRRGLSGVVRVTGQVPYAESLAEMARADVLLLLDSPGRRSGVPAKLYEYLGAGRSVLALAEPESDTAWVLRRSGVHHRIAAPTDSRGIRTALAELYEDLIGGHISPPDKERLASFTRERLTQDLVDLMNTCLASRQRR